MRFYKIIYILFYFLFFCTSVHTTSHYVDKNAIGKNNGTSWRNAWKSFSDINWSQIQPGDVLYISGGTDSTVYNESLDVQANGTAANLITVRSGLDEGHNGKVIIQGSGWSGAGISIISQSYIRVVGLTVRLWYQGITTDGGSNVIYVDSCNVNKCNWGFTTCTQGSGSDSIIVSYCRIISDSTTATQTDALSGTGCTWLEVRHCYIYQGNRYSKSGHSDVMQNRIAGHQLYYNNWFESVASGTDSSAATGLNGQLNLAADTTLMYNNVFITRGWVFVVFMDQGNTDHTWLMYNNTFIKEYDYTPAGVIQTNQVETFAKNNIIYSTNDKYCPLDWTPALVPDNSNFDYNLYYYPYAPGFMGTSTGATFSRWQSQGGDPNSPTPANPLFTNFNSPDDLDLTLQSGSPCRDAGTADVKALIESWGLPWTDYAGNPRSETTPSIGAYEYVP